MLKAGVIVAVLSLAGAAQAQSYDLVCTGTVQDEVDGPKAPHEYGFRIDLNAGRWCWDHCDTTFALVEVAPERLVLGRADRIDRRGRYWLENEVNRQTGRHELVSISTTPPAIYRHIEGQCEPAPFSGFPSPRF